MNNPFDRIDEIVTAFPHMTASPGTNRLGLALQHKVQVYEDLIADIKNTHDREQIEYLIIKAERKLND